MEELIKALQRFDSLETDILTMKPITYVNE